MAENLGLQEIYDHPVVQEIIAQNTEMRLTLSEKPDVGSLKDIPIPYTVKNNVLITAGVHNGKLYDAQTLRLAVNQHEGLPVFADHHKNDSGGTVQTWIGEIHNPVWSAKDGAVLGDIDVVDPKYAMAIAYGAKFGVSATINADILPDVDGSQKATDPLFVSYNMVLDPAVRETMLNENQGEENMSEETKPDELPGDSTDILLEAVSKPVLDKLDQAIQRAKAMKDTSLLKTLQEIKALLVKAYPYPKAEVVVQDTAALEKLEAEKKDLEDKLAGFEKEKLSARVDGILKKEIEVGLVSSEESDPRKKELEAYELSVLDAIEGNLDKTIEILSQEPDESTPEPEPKETEPESKSEELKQQQQLSQKPTDASRKFLDMMVAAQSGSEIPYGGK